MRSSLVKVSLSITLKVTRAEVGSPSTSKVKVLEALRNSGLSLPLMALVLCSWSPTFTWPGRVGCCCGDVGHVVMWWTHHNVRVTLVTKSDPRGVRVRQVLVVGEESSFSRLEWHLAGDHLDHQAPSPVPSPKMQGRGHPRPGVWSGVEGSGVEGVWRFGVGWRGVWRGCGGGVEWRRCGGGVEWRGCSEEVVTEYSL